MFKIALLVALFVMAGVEAQAFDWDKFQDAINGVGPNFEITPGSRAG